MTKQRERELAEEAVEIIFDSSLSKKEALDYLIGWLPEVFQEYHETTCVDCSTHIDSRAIRCKDCAEGYEAFLARMNP